MCLDTHAIYISTAYVTIEEKEIGLEVRVFEDDLRAVVRHHTGYIPDTSSLTFHEDVLSYFRKYLEAESGSNQLVWELDKKELVGDTYHLLFHSEFMSQEYDTLVLRANYFFELFPVQKNILRCRLGDEKIYHVFHQETLPLEIDLALLRE